MYNKRDHIAMVMGVAVLNTACLSCAELDTVSFERFGGNGNLTPIERAHLLDEVDNYLMDENDNYLTE